MRRADIGKAERDREPRARGRDDGEVDSTGYGRVVRNFAIVILAPFVFIAVAAVAFESDSSISGAEALALEAEASNGVDSELAEERHRRSRADPIVELLRSIRSGGFGDPRTLVTGRSKESFASDRKLLEGVDCESLQLERRGEGWIIVRAPSTSPDGTRSPLRLRFVEEGGAWKLEDVELLRSRQSGA